MALGLLRRNFSTTAQSRFGWRTMFSRNRCFNNSIIMCSHQQDLGYKGFIANIIIWNKYSAMRERTFTFLSPEGLFHEKSLGPQKFRGQQGDKREKVKKLKYLFTISYRLILFPASESSHTVFFRAGRGSRVARSFQGKMAQGYRLWRALWGWFVCSTAQNKPVEQANPFQRHLWSILPCSILPR